MGIRAISNHVVFSAGFRVFFFLGALAAVLLLPYWVLLITGIADYLPSTYAPAFWHQHEMIFGVLSAIIIGFIYTAVPNWTGQSVPTGLKLCLLALLWTLGRLALFFAGYLPAYIPIIVDGMFLPLAVMGIIPALKKAQQKRNYFLPIALMFFASLNILSHLGVLEIFEFTDDGFYMPALLLVVFLMNVIGGRVMNAFTKSSHPHAQLFAPAFLLPLSMVMIASVFFSFLYEAFDGEVDDKIQAYLAAGAGLVTLVRIIGLKGWVTWRNPLLYNLHLGYLWIVAGFFLLSYALYTDNILTSFPFHAFAVGAAGSLTLTLMIRAALGHSGRPVKNEPIYTAIFWLIHAAAISRVFLSFMIEGPYTHILGMAGLLWFLAYGLYLLKLTKILFTARYTPAML
jgi:uncharacterized protein involved in response to NO